MEEIEVKFLNIDPVILQEKLNSLGAKKTGEYLYRRRSFDYPDMRLAKQGAWVRLRTDGQKTTLAFKQRMGIGTHDGTSNDQGMKEIEIVVDDFEKTTEILSAIGFVEKFYQENKRIRWAKGTTEFDIDIWPRLNPYLEIEAQS